MPKTEHPKHRRTTKKKPVRDRLVRSWSEKGVDYSLFQRASGQWLVEADDGHGDFNCAVGSTPKAALAHLRLQDSDVPAADGKD